MYLHVRVIEIFLDSSLNNPLFILVLIIWVEWQVLRVLIAPEIIIRMISEILKESSPAIAI